MEWVNVFYASQFAWAGVYSGEVQEYHRRRAAALERYAASGPRRILELGAGGGQFSAAAADHGHSVVAVELVPALAEHIRLLAASRPALTVLEGDFYAVDPGEPFDLVVYLDGFGVGSDDDQRLLLSRVAGWLAPGGRALVDINTPWYWSAVAGREMQIGEVYRRYDYDADGNRMLDTWWPAGDRNQAVTQSLRCYAPADLRLLLRGTGLDLETYEPGGAVDYEQHQYLEQVPLARAMQYLAVLRAE